MGRLKAMVRSAIEDRSPRFLLATVALGVVVALVTGLAIGYTLDGGDGGSGARRTRVQRSNKPRAPKLKAQPLLVASVDSLKARKVVVLDPQKGKRRSMGIGRKTRVFATDDGKASDVKVGSRVLFVKSPTSETTATEVIVLPDKATLGDEVSAVTPGTSMSLRSFAGTAVIDTSDATFTKATIGKRADLVKGAKIVVRYFSVRGRRFQATNIVVLPKNTNFK
jgi:hypothetical protein